MAVVEYQVRRIRADEWRADRELRLEALKDSPLAFVERYDEARTSPEQRWRDRAVRDAGGNTSSGFVAVDGDRFVGKIGCFVEPEFTEFVSAHVVSVYVTPAARGSDVAERLMAATIQWARQEARADRLRLFVLETNSRAAAFYRRIGFHPTGATMAYPPDPRRTELEMEYRLAVDGQT